MKFNYNGHSYTFKDNILSDSTGKQVARFEHNQDGYHYFIDIGSTNVMDSVHENEVLFTQKHLVLAGVYEAFN